VLVIEARQSKEAPMAHKGNKPGREKRKPKKEKLLVAKPNRDSEVLQHVAQHGQPSESTRQI
jgi:hypothetical protein